jgi:hypothetical protein
VRTTLTMQGELWMWVEFFFEVCVHFDLCLVVCYAPCQNWICLKLKFSRLWRLSENC